MKARTLSVKQLVLLCVAVVVLVFGATYASWRVGSRPAQGTGGTTQQAPIWLKIIGPTTWPMPDPLKGGETYTDYEWHVAGLHDFWFRNDSDSAVQVGLLHKNCKCTKVELCILPPELKDKDDTELDKHAADPNLVWQVLEEGDRKGLSAPAHSAGGLRLNWKSEKLGKERLLAQLRTEGNSGVGDPIELNVLLNLVEGLQVHPEDNLREPPANGEVSVGTMRAGDVKVIQLICWSSTRTAFSIKVQPPDEPCISVGQPRPLTKEECAAFSQRDNQKVQCGYRVTVTVSERTEGGNQFELGRFRRYVTFVTEGSEPVRTAIGGIVRGEVTVGSEADHDMIVLGSWPREDAHSKSIALTTESKDVDLELETAPEFAKVGLEEVKAPGYLGRTWTLTVTVPPDSLSGPTPPHTAILLKTKGAKPRRIRIPVTGNAYVK